MIRSGKFPLLNAGLTRMLQVLVILGIDMVHDLGIFYYLVICALYLDDYFTGDDDDMKKKWQEVRNKIKWKMKLPAPAPAGSRVGS